MKQLLLMALMAIGSLAAYSQQFDPAPSALQEKLERFTLKYGTPHRVYPTEDNKRIFEAQDGERYVVYFIYDARSKVTRRAMVYELGSRNEKLSIKYPRSSMGMRDGNNQVFGVDFVANYSEGGSGRYRIDTNPETTVLIYHIKPGLQP